MIRFRVNGTLLSISDASLSVSRVYLPHLFGHTEDEGCHHTCHCCTQSDAAVSIAEEGGGRHLVCACNQSDAARAAEKEGVRGCTKSDAVPTAEED